ncbi:MAG: hypothetical protein D6675_08220 [Gemmatimonadetes bacterium]|nr:MAG: hypothetical protein D6675_08220 [Gemmatimonadota bacterium]
MRWTHSRKTHWYVSQESGSALVMALLFMIILSLLATAFLMMTSTESRIADNQAKGAQAYYTAEAGIEEAIRLIMYGDETYPHPLTKDTDPVTDKEFYGVTELYESLLGNDEYGSPTPDTLEIVLTGSDGVNDTIWVGLMGIQGTVAKTATNACMDDVSQVYGNIFTAPIVIDECEDINRPSTCYKAILVASSEGEIRKYVFKQGPDGCYNLEQIGDPWLDVPGNPDIRGNFVTKKVMLSDGSIKEILPDIDGDGAEDLIFKDTGDNGTNVYVYTRLNSTEPPILSASYQINSSQPSWWDLEVGNVDASIPGDELIVPSGNSLEILSKNSDGTMTSLGVINAKTYGSGQIHPDDVGNASSSRGHFVAKPVVADVTGDGVSDIIVNDGHFIHCYDGADPNPWNLREPRWTYRVGLQTQADGDGSLLTDGNGNLIPDRVNTSDDFVGDNHMTSWDLDGDGDLEIIATFNSGSQFGGRSYEASTHAVVLDDQDMVLNEVALDADLNWDGDKNDTDVHVADDIRIPLWPAAANADNTVDPGQLFAQHPPGVGNRDPQEVPEDLLEIMIQTSAGLLYVVNVAFERHLKSSSADYKGADWANLDWQDALTATYFYSNNNVKKDHQGHYRYAIKPNGEDRPISYRIDLGVPGGINGTPVFVEMDPEIPGLEIASGTSYDGTAAGFAAFGSTADGKLKSVGSLTLYPCDSDGANCGPNQTGNKRGFGNRMLVTDLNGDGYQEVIGATNNGADARRTGSINQEVQVYQFNNVGGSKIALSAHYTNPRDQTTREIETIVQLFPGDSKVNILQYLEH